jgi:hypothetical protein
MIDPFDVLKARTANQIREPDALIYLTRTATDDEILAAYHCEGPWDRWNMFHALAFPDRRDADDQIDPGP